MDKGTASRMGRSGNRTQARYRIEAETSAELTLKCGFCKETFVKPAGRPMPPLCPPCIEVRDEDLKDRVGVDFVEQCEAWDSVPKPRKVKA